MSTAMWALAFDRNGVYVVAKAASAWFPPKKLLSGEYAFFLGLGTYSIVNKVFDVFGC